MDTFDLFSKRQKRTQNDVPDTYSYDSIPQALRVQIVHIWKDTLGEEGKDYDFFYDTDSSLHVLNAYKSIIEVLCREYGIFKLPYAKDSKDRAYYSELISYLLKERSVVKVLGVIELSFWHIDRYTRDYRYRHIPKASEQADRAIEELNARFKEHAVGYQFVENKIVRIDSEFIHAEVVKPALILLSGKEYVGAQAEFLKAHEHYRRGNYKEALNEALKSFESVMKAICDKRNWQYSKKATCKSLIEICLDNGLIDSFWDQHFSSLRSMIESGVPTARNKLACHGQGSTIVEVPPHLVSYAIHMAAACIVFLVESEQALT